LDFNFFSGFSFCDPKLVKLARHVLTGREVAIKVIDKKNITTTNLNKLFREVRIMKMLHHPNVGECDKSISCGEI